MITRRDFLKISGLAALGLACVPAVSLLADSRASAGGPRWGMAVDMDRCRLSEGCRACMRACHAAHNVPTVPDPRHEVKWIWPEGFPAIFPEHGAEALDQAGLAGAAFPVLCNHCEHPACVKVCPTQATFRRADGAVMMDYHRCIGCRYCMAACPYGARSFNFVDPRDHLSQVTPSYPTRTRGVVEKCDLCATRVGRGQAPICAGACPHGALVFGDLNDPQSPLRRALEGRFALRRKADLGTEPKVFYLVPTTPA